MEYISNAGLAWLARHNLKTDQMIDRWHMGLPITPRPRPIDSEYDPIANQMPEGGIIFRKNLWRTSQNLNRFDYIETGTRHAKLTIKRLQVPETILALGKKAIPLEDLISVPAKCIASEAMGKIIRISNNENDSVELLLRIKWYPMNLAYMLERM